MLIPLLIDMKVIVVCPAGFHAASPVRKRVHAPGISQESSEEGGGQENALQRLHHERLVRVPSVSFIFSLFHTNKHENVCCYSSFYENLNETAIEINKI